MSALGHSLQTHSAPVPINVRYASDSDHSRHGSELTRSANSGLMHRGKTASFLLDHFVGAIEPECGLIAFAFNRGRLPLVMHEQCKQQNDWQRDPQQPQ
jgi:hypothetical protein